MAEKCIFHVEWPAQTAPNSTQRQQVTFLSVTSISVMLPSALSPFSFFFFSMQHCFCQSVSATCWEGEAACQAGITEARTSQCVWLCEKFVWITDIFSRPSWRNLAKYNLVVHANMSLLTDWTWMPLHNGINTKTPHIKMLRCYWLYFELPRGLTVQCFPWDILYIFFSKIKVSCVDIIFHWRKKKISM